MKVCDVGGGDQITRVIRFSNAHTSVTLRRRNTYSPRPLMRIVQREEIAYGSSLAERLRRMQGRCCLSV